MSGSRININSATLDQMIDFFKNKGIINSKKLAESIIQYRIDNGAFMSIDGLLNVNGITNKTLDKLRSLVTTRNISDDFANFVMESIKGYNSEITLHEVTESLYGDEYFYALYLSDYQQSKKSRIPGQNKETIASLVHNMFPLLPKEELSEYFSDDEMFFDWYNARLNSLISFYAQRNGKSFSDAKEELSDRRKLEVTKKLYSEHMRSNSNDGQLIDYVCFKKNDSLENVIKDLSSDSALRSVWQNRYDYDKQAMVNFMCIEFSGITREQAEASLSKQENFELMLALQRQKQFKAVKQPEENNKQSSIEPEVKASIQAKNDEQVLDMEPPATALPAENLPSNSRLNQIIDNFKNDKERWTTLGISIGVLYAVSFIAAGPAGLALRTGALLAGTAVTFAYKKIKETKLGKMLEDKSKQTGVYKEALKVLNGEKAENLYNKIANARKAYHTKRHELLTEGYDKDYNPLDDSTALMTDEMKAKAQQRERIIAYLNKIDAKTSAKQILGNGGKTAIIFGAPFLGAQFPVAPVFTGGMVGSMLDKDTKTEVIDTKPNINQETNDDTVIEHTEEGYIPNLGGIENEQMPEYTSGGKSR